MRLANRVVDKRAANDTDPREGMSAEVIDLASRTAFPAVTQRKGKSDGLGLLAGVGIVGLLGAVTLWSMDAARNPRADQNPATIPESTPVPVEVPPVEQAPRPMVAAPPAPAPAAPRVAVGPAPGAATNVNPYSSPTVVFDASALPAPAEPAAAPGAATGNSAGDFAARIGGVGGGPARAAISIDPRTTVTQGTMIPAILETAINTDVPGYVRAVVSRDVRSFDGARVLVPRSSRLIGQYQSGLQAGQRRAYVIWTRLLRPDGVSVALSSPGTDFAGTAGLPGKVDNHFFKRFGSAMLLSVVGGLASAGTGGAGFILGGGQSAAATAAQQDGQVGPTIRVRQGEPIRVFTARDLDFSQVTTQ